MTNNSTLTSSLILSLKNPILILTLIYGSASMGIFTSFTFYYFQNYLQDKIVYFFIMYCGIVIANLIGFLIGFNISKRYIRMLIYLSCLVQVISFPVILLVYLVNIQVTVLLLIIFGFFDALIGLYLIPRANRVQSYDNRLRHNIKLWGFLYLGMSAFAILFIIYIPLAFLFGSITTLFGSIGLIFLIRDDKNKYLEYKREPIKEVFRSDYLSYLVLFSMYFMFFFSVISILALQSPFLETFSNKSLVIFLLPLLIVNALAPLVIWYKVNKRFPLRSIFNLTYVVGSISLILMYNNPDFLIYAYALELWTWSVFQIYIFVNIGDTYPGLRNIQPINFWWLMLAISVGLGILLPLLIPNNSVLISFMLVSMLLSIALFAFLKTFKQPYKIYLLLIQSKDGQNILEKSFFNFELNTDFLSGVFNAVNVLFKESFKSSTNFLRSIEYENKTLILSESELFYCIAIADHYDNLLRKSLLEISNLFEVSYYNRIKQLTKSDESMNHFKLNVSDLPVILQQKIFSLESA